MSVAFPLTPAPAYYTTITPGQAKGVFFAGGTAPFVTLNKTGATAYAVRDYFGNVVSSGAVSGTTVTPTAPGGGWAPGWYRLYLTGGSTDALFGPAYGSSNFAVLRSDTRFPAPTSGGTDAGLVNQAGRAVFGLGTARMQIDNANAPTTGTSTIAVAQAEIVTSKANWNVSSGALFDSARSRLPWIAFPNGTSDKVTVGNLHVYCKDGTVDGSTVTVTAVAGTSSGIKITVNAETYDNLPDAPTAAAALNASALVRGFGSGSLSTLTATAVGNAYYNGVKSVVTALYPDVTRYEGPSNEPAPSAEVAHQMRLFQAAVHAGNASALAIGPCPVSVATSYFEPFFAAGGGAYCDEISFHDYNGQTLGDLNLGRTTKTNLTALLAKYGLSGKPLWQTESTNVLSSVYGVYHPRRSRVPLLMTLQWEQWGIPRERNSPWYDSSHGFWSFPAWWLNGDDTVNPFAVLYRVLGEETFGQTHNSAMSFGTWGDKMIVGSIYAGASSSTAVMMSQSAMPGATVTLAVTGTTSPLTCVDGFGNSSTLTIAAGKVVVPLNDIPTYLRLPAGVTVTVSRCNDWPTSQAGWANGTAGYPVTVTGTVGPASFVADGKWLTQYSGTLSNDGAAVGTAMPDTLAITWPTATRVDRVLIFGGAWQSLSALVDFDVQTSVDGTTWVTQATVTKTDCASFQHGSDSNGAGCQRETYWSEQWIFDVKLPAAVTCKAVRLNVRASSYGGEPDAACVTSGGQGNSAQYITIQEIVTLCDDNVATPHYGGR